MSEERVSEKFTPGAWETWASRHEMADTGEYYDEISVMANGKQIAVMCGDLDDDEMEANANIMAAGPAMYAALQDVCRKCWDKPRLVEGFDGDPLDRPCGECPVRKAMAKARGEK